MTARSRRLRKDVEAVVLEFEWNSTGATAESTDEDPVDVESPTEPQSDPGVER